jgi:amino acid adenylation domain-containing protein
MDAIRHFAYGTSDDNPLWLDSSYAARTCFGRPVAPPAFLTSVLYPVLHGAPVETVLSNLISELTFQWYLPVFEGDSLQANSKQTDVLETQDRNGETLICINSETNYWNQRDECVAKAACTLTRALQKHGALRVDRPIYRYSDDELAAIGEAQRQARRSGDRLLDPRRINIGEELPPLVRGPMTIGDLVCWQTAIGPAYRAGALGYRDALAVPHSTVKHPITGWPVRDSQQHEDFLLAAQRGMPLPFDNGVMRFAWVCPLLTDWMGDDGTLQRLTVRLIAPNLYGDTTWYRGTVVSKTHVDEGMVTGIRITGSNQVGETTTIGDAIVLIPLRPTRSLRTEAFSIDQEAERLRATEGSAKSVTDLIREHAARHPSKSALIAGDLTMTYAQLIAKVGRLAVSLRRGSAASEKIVGVLFERGADYVVAALALFEAGATLLPLDAAYPAQRLKRIVEDAAPDLLLTREALRERIPRTQAEVVTFENFAREFVDASSDKDSHSVEPGRTAYVLYTSGSTGEPIGVTVPHTSLFRYVLTLPEALGFNEDDIFIHTASFSFSASMRQLFMPLCLGSTVIIADDNERMNMRVLFELIKRRGATVWDTVPAVWRQAIDTLRSLPVGEQRELLDHRLRLILLTGEALTWDLPEAWRHELKHPARVINLYSQTETAGTVACYCLPEVHGKQSGIVPLGRPVAGAILHLLDEDGRPVPDGEVGEIAVGGRRLASGYLRRPDLTASRFIPISTGGDGEACTYRTGDLGRRRADGTVEFVGRADDRLKMRGYRIEPAEVASVLGEHPVVRHVTVVARTDPAGHQRLVAYVVPSPAAAVSATGSRSLSTAELRRFATERLPNYMVPSAFVLLTELPRSPNGKIDRLALPEPIWSQPEVGAEPSLPQTAIEQRLTALWADALGLEHVGTEDDFLELGGDSIKAMQILNLIRKELEVSLPGAILFSVRTVAALAKEVEKQLKSQAQP